MSVHELGPCTIIHQTHVKNNVESFFRDFDSRFNFVENRCSLNFFVYIDNVKAIAPLRVRVTILFVSRKTEIILTLIF